MAWKLLFLGTLLVFVVLGILAASLSLGVADGIKTLAP